MNNSVAIMQPYLFPYIGYLCLLKASNHFVFYDDVNFIKKGWIHRNRILVNGREHLFTVPLEKSSQNLKINEIRISDFNTFRTAFLKKTALAYKKAPCFEQGLAYIEQVLQTDAHYISDLAIRSVTELSNLFSIKTCFYQSSRSFAATAEAGRAERLIEIVHSLGAQDYINAAGGKALYQKSLFKEQGVNLSFLSPILDEYPQLNSKFIPGLSIIDLMMHLPLPTVAHMMDNYYLE